IRKLPNSKEDISTKGNEKKLLAFTGELSSALKSNKNSCRNSLVKKISAGWIPHFLHLINKSLL
ncbi:MAG TPA: hypothetical protein PL089_08325, partial [Ignavibacteria bacterium]|nr:hypothetical protein [Ignavibacteria bacterium]